MSLSQPPDGWERVAVGDLGFVYGGLSGKSAADFGSGEARYITFLEVINSTRVDGRNAQAVQVGPRESQNRVREGDVLFNGTSETPNELALAAIVTDEIPNLYLNSFCFGLRPYDRARLVPLFLAYLFRSGVGRELMGALAQGATRYNLSKKQFSRLVLPLPALAEQRRIATALSDVDDLIASLEGLIGKKSMVRAASAHRLLNGRTALTRPRAEWSEYRLEQLGQWMKGRGIRKDDVSLSGVPCVRYGELYTRYRNYTDTLETHVPPNVAKTSLPLQQGDLLFTASGETKEEIGTALAYMGTQPAVAGGDLIVMRPRGTHHNPVFVSHILNSPAVTAEKARFGQGDAVVHINARALGSLRVQLPPKNEQDAVAEALVDMDAEISSVQWRLDKTRDVKRGMMQELLTGRTRLPAEEAAA